CGGAGSGAGADRPNQPVTAAHQDHRTADGRGRLIGGTLNIKHVRAHWDDILRLASSIKQGTVTASLMLRELGRIERTLFILDWLQSVELRRRVHAGLNKG
ncbi:Tn3 family transposase, partial [Escherichia coli]